MTAALLVFTVVYDTIAILILYQWNSPDPWARLDLFSGGYLLLSTFLAIARAVTMSAIAPTPEALRVFASEHVDPYSKYWIIALSLAEFAVFYDYAHWRIAPWLERGFLQGLGLGFTLGGLVWMSVAGSYLARNFQRARRSGILLTGGPYAVMRHPIYSALIATRVGFAFLLASPIAWLLTALWLYFIARRIRREEARLRQDFPGLYDAYARDTPALVHESVARLFRRDHQSTTDPSSGS